MSSCARCRAASCASGQIGSAGWNPLILYVSGLRGSPFFVSPPAAPWNTLCSIALLVENLYKNCSNLDKGSKAWYWKQVTSRLGKVKRASRWALLILMPVIYVETTKISDLILLPRFRYQWVSRWSSVSPIVGGYPTTPRVTRGRWWGPLVASWFSRYGLFLPISEWLIWPQTWTHYFQYLKKRPSVPKCPMTGLKLKGVTPATNQEKARMSRRQKTVFRFPIVLVFLS